MENNKCQEIKEGLFFKEDFEKLKGMNYCLFIKEGKIMDLDKMGEKQ